MKKIAQKEQRNIRINFINGLLAVEGIREELRLKKAILEIRLKREEEIRS